MMFRSAASALLLLCATAFSQTPVSNVPKSFHDPVLNITYFYPGRFEPAPPAPPAKAEPSSSSSSSSTPSQQCVQSNLSASSLSPAGPSVFVLSTIDGTCPNILRGATVLGPFIREQILRQMKRYGDATITQEPSHYVIDGHPAAVVLASATPPDAPTDGIHQPKITYAAKACLLGNVPEKPKKRSDPVDPIRHVLCFDFTTQDQSLLSLLYGFSMQFDNGQPQPIIPGSAIR
jgi:hypothetical protein